MNQLLIVEFFVKDQASATTLWDILGERGAAMKDSGFKKIDWYVNQDDPKYLVYIAQWASRGHYDDYLKWARAQPNSEEFEACFASPPRVIWLDKTEA